MTSSTPVPPDSTEEKAYSGDTPPKPLAEVSEALNGLRELAERVTPAKNKSTSTLPDLNMPKEQLDLGLPRAEIPVDAVSSEASAAPLPIVQIPDVEPRVQVIETTLSEPKAEFYVAPPPAKPERKPPVGATLREARLSAGFSLDEVADEIKIKPVYLQAIEEGHYENLPSRTYAVGWVRSYAQALGLHAEELVARCRAEVGALPRIAPVPLVMREPVPDRRFPTGALMMICIVLAVIAYVVSYGYFRPQPPETNSYIPPKPEIVAQPEALPAPVNPPAPVAAAPVQETAPAPVPVAPAAEVKPKIAKPAPVAEEDLNETDDTLPPLNEEARPEEKAESKNAETPLAPRMSVGKSADTKRPQVIPGAAPEDITPGAPSPVAAQANSAVPDLNAKPPVKVKPPSRIKLRATADTSVRIVDAQGQVLAERTIKKGESFYVPDHQHYTLSTSNAGAVRLAVDGRDMPVLGDSGEAMHNIPLDPSDLLQVLAQ